MGQSDCHCDLAEIPQILCQKESSALALGLEALNTSGHEVGADVEAVATFVLHEVVGEVEAAAAAVTDDVVAEVAVETVTGAVPDAAGATGSGRCDVVG